MEYSIQRCGFRETCEKKEAELTALRARVAELERFANFARSCILSGESWSEVAEAAYNAAIDGREE